MAKKMKTTGDETPRNHTLPQAPQASKSVVILVHSSSSDACTFDYTKGVSESSNRSTPDSPVVTLMPQREDNSSEMVATVTLLDREQTISLVSNEESSSNGQNSVEMDKQLISHDQYVAFIQADDGQAAPILNEEMEEENFVHFMSMTDTNCMSTLNCNEQQEPFTLDNVARNALTVSQSASGIESNLSEFPDDGNERGSVQVQDVSKLSLEDRLHVLEHLSPPLRKTPHFLRSSTPTIKSMRHTHKSTSKVLPLKPQPSSDSLNPSTLYICDLCGVCFEQPAQYYSHLRCHKDTRIHRCGLCPQEVGAFATPAQLRAHVQRQHPGERAHACLLCPARFHRPSQLGYHVRRAHAGERPHMCAFCPKAFFKRSDLRTHLNVHLGINQSVCETCGRRFGHVSNLIRHVRTHSGVRPYPCPECGRRFSQLNAMQQHRASHGDSGRVPCAVCGRLYKSAPVMRKHVRIAHGARLIPAESGAAHVGPRSRKFYCAACGDSFEFADLLRQHEKEHEAAAGAGKLTCGCGLAFGTVSELRTHACTPPKSQSRPQLHAKSNAAPQPRGDTLSPPPALPTPPPAESLNLPTSPSGDTSSIQKTAGKDDLLQLAFASTQSQVSESPSRSVFSSSPVSPPQLIESVPSCSTTASSITTNICATTSDTRTSIIAPEPTLFNSDSNLPCEPSMAQNENDNRALLESLFDEIAAVVEQDGDDEEVALDNSSTIEPLNCESVAVLSKDAPMENVILLVTSDDSTVEGGNAETTAFLLTQSHAAALSLPKPSESSLFPSLPPTPPPQQPPPPELVSFRQNTEDFCVEPVSNQQKSKQETDNSMSNSMESKKTSASPKKKKQQQQQSSYTCSECGKIFYKRGNYKQHLGMHFVDHKTHRCPVCGLLFAWKSTLNKHIIKAHSEGLIPSHAHCEFCDREYSTVAQVQEHIRRDHFLQRPHACSEPSCTKRFFKKHDLKVHLRMHSKERPYICESCGKSFNHTSHIIRHERIHSGLQPYRCADCGRHFNQSSTLKSHKQRHQVKKQQQLQKQQLERQLQLQQQQQEKQTSLLDKQFLNRNVLEDSVLESSNLEALEEIELGNRILETPEDAASLLSMPSLQGGNPPESLLVLSVTDAEMLGLPSGIILSEGLFPDID